MIQDTQEWLGTMTEDVDLVTDDEIRTVKLSGATRAQSHLKFSAKRW